MAPTNKPAKSTQAYQDKCLAKARKRIEAALKPHKQRVRDYDRRYRAYRGVIDRDKNRWNHQVCPPYIFQVIETMESGLVDDATVTKVYPSQPGSEAGAEALEKLLRQQQDKGNYDEQKGAFTKTALIYGVAFGKIRWRETRESVTRNVWLNGPDNPPEEQTEVEVTFDQPEFLNCDPKEIFWDPHATSVDDAQYIAHRYYVTRDWIKTMGAPGPDNPDEEPPLWMNTQELLDSQPLTDGGLDAESTRNAIPHQTQASKQGLYEIIEIWENDHLTVVGNRCILLQDGPNPFWHNTKPFVVGLTLTDLSRLEGQSEVEVLIDLQNCLWDFLNQTLDNAELANNAIVMMSSDVEDPDAYPFFPGARWFVDRQDEVQMWTPNSNVLSASQGIQDDLKGDLQSIAAALPYLSGAASETVDQTTATGISIISNMAQRRILRKKALLNYAYKRAGRQWIALNQQFMTEPLAIRIDGPQGSSFRTVSPYEIQGQYDYYVESMVESLDRQQKRQEALDLLNTMATVAPALPIFAQVGLNAKAFIEKLLSSFDIMNPDDFFQAIQQQAAPALPQPFMPQQLPPPAAPPQLNGVYQAPQIAAHNPLAPSQ